jgi:hypothetical protein
MAFSPWTRAILTVCVKVPIAFMAEYTGLWAAWKRLITDHETLERKGREKLEYIYKRQERKDARKREGERSKMIESNGGSGLSSGACMV